MRIGFSFNRANAGPSNFMKALKCSFEEQNLSKTSLYFNPLNDCNIFANLPKLTWLHPFYFRLDGIIYDIMADPEYKRNSNNTYLSGAQRAKGVIFQSEFSKKLFENILGFVAPVQTVIHNGTNLSIFKRAKDHSIRQRLGIENDAFVFVTSAKWRSHKRLDDMLRAFVDFKERHTELKTYFIVLGDYQEQYIDNVFFMQKVPNYDLPKYFNAANVYLFFSWLDPCPNSVVEAISSGLPVICTNNGGTPELVKMSNGGIVVEADDPFLYTEVDLYNPPLPNKEKIDQALDDMYLNYDKYVNRINRNVFDINIVARKYFDFMKKNM